MNYIELKQEIMNLAFEDEGSMKEYEGIVNDAVNRAVDTVCTTVRPVVAEVTIDHPETDRELIKYDVESLARERGGQYMGLEGTVIREYGTVYNRQAEYEVEAEKYILLRGTLPGLYTVYYKKAPKKYQDYSPDEELEIARELHVLIPLLASFYVWLDDDRTKAEYYKNEYEDLKQQILFNGITTGTGVGMRTIYRGDW